ncbi:excalibur calcium-binding domain-containing protein [Leifsonia sp. NPDC058230]|uniref:excalibur calcium-binding domain-containing protein n=1 Tax=Leifsonia sp. NPDC058230 TaxID=3346391 RepID=UPI0036DEE3E9
MKGLTPLSWLAIAGLGLLVVIGFASSGFFGGLIIAGLIALVTGIYSAVTGRSSWARIAGRKVAVGVLAGGLATTLVSGAVYGAINPKPADSPVAVASSPTPGETVKATPSSTNARNSSAEPDAPESVTEPAENASVTIADSGATQGTALALLETLPVKGRAPKTGYDRIGQFGSAWLDVDRNGCDTRNDILARDLQPSVKSGQCKVTSGTLNDPYTGKTIGFVRGNTTSLAVQIDHVVALLNAWETGAQQLTPAQRITLANDPMNLFAVDGPANNQKGAGDAATWLPSNKSFRCTYVARQVSVKATYGLWVTQPEHDAIKRILTNCSSEPAITSAFAPRPGPSPTIAPAPARPAPAPAPAPVPAPAPPAPAAPAPAPSAPDVSYANCTAVRAAGKAPLHVGEPGYSRKLDRDGDGVACE